jgi:hypothetical protein
VAQASPVRRLGVEWGFLPLESFEIEHIGEDMAHRIQHVLPKLSVSFRSCDSRSTMVRRIRVTARSIPAEWLTEQLNSPAIRGDAFRLMKKINAMRAETHGVLRHWVAHQQQQALLDRLRVLARRVEVGRGGNEKSVTSNWIGGEVDMKDLLENHQYRRHRRRAPDTSKRHRFGGYGRLAAIADIALTEIEDGMGFYLGDESEI